MTIEPPVVAAPKRAATVILLREHDGRVEVFLMKRSGLSDVLGLAHVFPGGKVDAADGDGDEGLIAAAIRETREEAGVAIDAAGLAPWTRWITPEILAKRFDATFFVARLPEGAAPTHDGHELTHSDWMTAARALDLSARDEILLAPPTHVTLCELAQFSSIDAVVGHAAGRRPPAIQPVGFDVDGVRFLALPGDERHPIRAQIVPGPTRFRWNGARFVPDAGA